MANDSCHLLWYLVLLSAAYLSNSQCTNGGCEKKSLSLKTDTKENSLLEGHVFETLTLTMWEECYNVCVRKCQCLSFNFNEVNKSENCELNDATERQAPKARKVREGVTYYEIGRAYYDSNGVPRQTCSETTCHNQCCDTTVCQNGGTCNEVCDVNERRFNCTCPPGFTGYKCQYPPTRSCKDIMVIHKETTNGIYNIVDQNNNSYPVYCDFCSESGAAWTLIQSYSLQNHITFKGKSFYLHDLPINQDAPEWSSYRLSMSRMKSIRDFSTHWRATCNFPTDGVDFRDYWRVSLEQIDIVEIPALNWFCLETEFVNVHGNECSNCTVWFVYSPTFDLHLDSQLGQSRGCDLSGGITSEDNFGYYDNINPAFRCTSSMSSTTQFWFGSF